MMPCGLRKTLVIMLMRAVVCPLATLLVLLLFRVRGEELRLLVMSAALPQALSSFVVFKEFKIQPEVFSTSMTVGTVLCLPVVCTWCAAALHCRNKKSVFVSMCSEQAPAARAGTTS
jgi:auxin efflux carrier family